MLSEKEIRPGEKKLSLPLLETPQTVRIKFCKIGNLQFISHLDLQRTFHRVLVRANIPMWYTKGFNPHAKLVFSTPLSVGAQSEYEFLDVRIDRDMPCEEIMARMNREMTEELCITKAYIPTHDFSEIAWSSYVLEIKTAGANMELACRIENLLRTSPVYLVKKTKAGEKEIDIVPMIRLLNAEYREDGIIEIRTVLKAASTEFLNPEMLITAMKRELGILSGNPTEEWYSILRTSVMDAEMNLFR